MLQIMAPSPMFRSTKSLRPGKKSMVKIASGNGLRGMKTGTKNPGTILVKRKSFEFHNLSSDKLKDLKMTDLRKLIIVIKGAGEMASAVAWRLYRANMQKVLMLETDNPLAVRREVSFCEAVHDGHKTVEEVEAVRVQSLTDIHQAWEHGKIAVAADSQWNLLEKVRPDVVVDAILAKKNLGTRMQDAVLVIGLGPGFGAGSDVHLVVETNRGHNLGRIITAGSAEPNTGIPGTIGGFAEERVLRAPTDGKFTTRRSIGDHLKEDDIVGFVMKAEVRTKIGGVIRGLIRSDTSVTNGLKLGDIDPRGQPHYCYTISDKARAIGGSVLEAVMRFYNIDKA
jgi:xanthine dehydrogenase accessory factor